MLLEIDEEKQEYAIRLLRCLAFSRRPLRAKELAEVLAIQLDSAIPRLDTSLRPGDAQEAVLSACSTLVTTIELDDYDYGDHGDGNTCNSLVVQFSHYSVKEFLTSERLAKSDKRDLSQYYISRGCAHTILAQSCISTLLRPDIHIAHITDSFPLAKYAAQNWFHHAQCDGVASQIQEGMERLFDSDRKHFAVWISIHDIDDPRSLEPSTRTEASPLYYATLCGIVSLVEHLVIERRQDPNKSYGRQGTPIQAAESSGNFDIVHLLLRHGADAETLCNRGNSLLRKAIQLQKLYFAELLLKGGADANVRSQFPDNTTLLDEAMDIGNVDLAQWLISHGADVNTLSLQGGSPLHKAVRLQKLDAVEFLLKNGADVNSRDAHNSTLLHEAVESGNIDTMKILLSHGAGVNALDCFWDSPLHKVLQSQKIDLLDFPANSAADVNPWQNQNILLPLRVTQQGDFPDFLVNSAADLNSWQNQDILLPLRVTQKGNYAAAQLLLSHGADVNARESCNRTPLHLASLEGSLDVSRLLIEHGADVDAQDDDCQTPFSIALANGHRKLARFLSNDRVPHYA